jgi:hypothetical protein
MTKTGVGRWRLLVVCLAGVTAVGGWAWWERRSPALTAAELSTRFRRCRTIADRQGRTLWAARALGIPETSWHGPASAYPHAVPRDDGRRLLRPCREAAFVHALELAPPTPATGLAWVNGSRQEFERSIEWAKKAIDPQQPDATACGRRGRWWVLRRRVKN